MAISNGDLQTLLGNEGMNFFVHPQTNALLFNFTGMFARHQAVVSLQSDGTFLQFRSLGYSKCEPSHPNILAVLQVLGQINYLRKSVKFGWDPNDGEIVAYVDHAIEDGGVSQAQFHQLLWVFLVVIDLSSKRLADTLATGRDPGDPDPNAVTGGAAVPDRM